MSAPKPLVVGFFLACVAVVPTLADDPQTEAEFAVPLRNSKSGKLDRRVSHIRCTFDESPRSRHRGKHGRMPLESVVALGSAMITEQTAEPTDVVTNSLGMKLVYIPPGSFLMGSTKEEIAVHNRVYGREGRYDAEGPRHPVEITRGFRMGAYEVTVGQFKQFVAADGYRTEAEKDGRGGYGYNDANGGIAEKPEYSWRNPGWRQTDDHPVVNVTWNDAKAFCAWLSRREGKVYGLPTEAQWEYACRAGTTTAYYSGDDPETLARVGNVPDATAKGKFADWEHTIKAADGYVFTAPVGQFRKNGFGLFDMHGNVGEWCEDWYDAKYYENSPQKDPVNTAQGKFRVIRGGAWGVDAGDCRSARRNCHVPEWRDFDYGFRVVLTSR